MPRRARPIYYDVTTPIRSGMLVYPGDPAVVVEPVAAIERDGFAAARLTMSTHTGTHLDPPAHFVTAGMTVDQAPLDLLIGRARVVDVTGGRAIGPEVVGREALHGVERVLFRTRAAPQTPEAPDLDAYAYLAPETARRLVAAGARLVGIDTLSVDPLEIGDASAHHELLHAGVWILERLDLSAVPPGEYDLLCLPLKIASGDGAPARVVLRGRT